MDLRCRASFLSAMALHTGCSLDVKTLAQQFKMVTHTEETVTWKWVIPIMVSHDCDIWCKSAWLLLLHKHIWYCSHSLLQPPEEAVWFSSHNLHNFWQNSTWLVSEKPQQKSGLLCCAGAAERVTLRFSVFPKPCPFPQINLHFSWLILFHWNCKWTHFSCEKAVYSVSPWSSK